MAKYDPARGALNKARRHQYRQCPAARDRDRRQQEAELKKVADALPKDGMPATPEGLVEAVERAEARKLAESLGVPEEEAYRLIRYGLVPTRRYMSGEQIRDAGG